MKKNKIIIGTTQFGLPYGIMNFTKKNKKNELKKILSLAKKEMINDLYTSKYYGSANKFLIENNLSLFQIYLKFKSSDIILKSFNNELKKLKSKFKKKNIIIIIDGFELLNFKDSSKIYENLINLKKTKDIFKFGFSIYDFKNLKKICKRFKPDIIQCPYSIVDRRLEKNGLIQYFFENKIKIHVRSIFLQGLLLTNISTLPKKFLKWKKIFYDYDDFVRNYKITKIEGCLNFVINNKFINKVLIGVDNYKQFEEILTIRNNRKIKLPYIANFNENLINPSRW